MPTDVDIATRDDVAIDASTQRTRVRNLVGGIISFAERLIGNPIFSYAVLLAIQLRVIWNIWRALDLVAGDEAAYFSMATNWSHGFKDQFAWSPLYGVFWGTILDVVRGISVSAMTQHLIIVFGLAVMVLAIGRALLGPSLGLLVAIWWVLIPNEHDFLYSVHPFGYLPPFLALVIVLRWPRREGIGVATGILLATAALDRNELILAFLVVAFAVLVYEVIEFRNGRRASLVTYLRAYVLPLGISMAFVSFLYTRSYIPGVRLAIQAKSELGFCQSFARVYEERIPGRFVGNPYTQCGTLMQRLFHTPLPSISHAILVNPAQVAGYFGWNLQQLPAALQDILFGSSSYFYDSGIPGVNQRSSEALVLSILSITVLIVGLAIAIRGGRLSLRRVPQAKVWGVLILVAIVVDDLIVAAYSPAPEYLYGLTLGVLALIAASVSICLRRIGALRVLAPVALVVVVVVLVLASSAYKPAPTPLRDDVAHLLVVQRQLQQPGSILVNDGEEFTLCEYLTYNYAHTCGFGADWATLRNMVTTHLSLEEVLSENHATVIYADEAMLGDSELKKLIARSPSDGWSQVAHGNSAEGRWSVLVRTDARPPIK